VIRTPLEAIEAARALRFDLAEHAAVHDADGSFPADDFALLRGAGLLGMMAPMSLGGAEAGFADYAEVAMELGAGAGSTALIFNMHASVTGALALTSEDMFRAVGVPETFFALRDRVLSAATRGALFCVAMSERAAGSRLSQLATSYERVDGGWHIVGSKAFCSGAGHADGYLVAAGTTDPVTGGRTISQFLVPAGRPGITVQQTWDSLGMRATGSHDIHFDVTVDDDALVGGMEGLGVLLAQAMPQWLVASYAAVYVGVAQSALDTATAYARARELRRLPLVRARFGRADAAVTAAREVVRQAARMVDTAPGDPETNRWVWRAKLLAGDTAAEVASSLLEACGTGASRRGNDLERIFRDARCGSLQPATSDVCSDWLGTAVLGLDPELEADIPRW
jgi:alkylation response protein AidB-like acyl-CoA dehydrogenase